MTSLTSTAHALTPGARQGRSRAALSYQGNSRSARSPAKSTSTSMTAASSHVGCTAIAARRAGPAGPGRYRDPDMFHPVGSQPASVYWRRRLALLGTLLILVVLVIVTARVLLGGDGAAA